MIPDTETYDTGTHSDKDGNTYKFKINGELIKCFDHTGRRLPIVPYNIDLTCEENIDRYSARFGLTLIK